MLGTSVGSTPVTKRVMVLTGPFRCSPCFGNSGFGNCDPEIIRFPKILPQMFLEISEATSHSMLGRCIFPEIYVRTYISGNIPNSEFKLPIISSENCIFGYLHISDNMSGNKLFPKKGFRKEKGFSGKQCPDIFDILPEIYSEIQTMYFRKYRLSNF